MRLICPACAAIVSLDALTSDPETRQFVKTLIGLPPEVQRRIPAYLGLFRKDKGRALAWAKAAKLVGQLAALVEAGTVQWEGYETRPAPASLWAEALDVVIEKRPKALTNHNYLRHVAWERAAPLAAKEEREGERRTAVSRSHVREPDPEPGKRRNTCYMCRHFKPAARICMKNGKVQDHPEWGCKEFEAKSAVSAIGDVVSAIGDMVNEVADNLQEK